jgi:RIO kinase 1
MAKKSLEKFKTKHGVFDEFTNRNLFKLITEGQFEGIIGPVSVGKESNVFLAKKGSKNVIVKIYRLETCDFNRMYDYLRYDPRYTSLKKNKRYIIFSWAQREFRNLHLARESGVRVPTPFTLKHNIIVMEMIGDKQPAPMLKDRLPEDMKSFADTTFKAIKKLHKAGIAHGDLSSFNILNWNDKPVFIDFSQASLKKNIRFEELVQRDVHNLVNYFNRHGLDLEEDKMFDSLKH